MKICLKVTEYSTALLWTRSLCSVCFMIWLISAAHFCEYRWVCGLTRTLYLKRRWCFWLRLFVCLSVYLSVCLSLSNIIYRLQAYCSKFYGWLKGGKRNKWLDFGSKTEHNPALVEVCTSECMEYDDCLWICGGEGASPGGFIFFQMNYFLE